MHITNNPEGSYAAQPLIDLDVELLALAALALRAEAVEKTAGDRPAGKPSYAKKQTLAVALLAASDNARGAALP